MRQILLAVSLALSASVAVAQGAPGQVATHAVVVLPDQVTWGPAPPILPAGAKGAVPAAERVTVIEGTFQLGMGDKFDESELQSLPAGSYVSMKPGTHHFARAKGNTIVQINGIGPWKLIYLNPADDPRKATP